MISIKENSEKTVYLFTTPLIIDDELNIVMRHTAHDELKQLANLHGITLKHHTATVSDDDNNTVVLAVEVDHAQETPAWRYDVLTLLLKSN